MYKSIIKNEFYDIKCNFIGNIIQSEFFHELEKENIQFLQMKQKHSTIINFVHNKNKEILIGDGVFTNVKDLNISINCHDCIGLGVISPMLAGVVHLSWKNIYLGIIDKIFKVLNENSVNIDKVIFFISPHIMKDSMEVNFYDLWKNHEYNKYNLKSCFFLNEENNKTFMCMEDILINVITQKYSVNKKNIIKNYIDTYKNTQYASYRRDGIESPYTNILSIQI